MMTVGTLIGCPRCLNMALSRFIKLTSHDQISQFPQIIHRVVSQINSPFVSIRCWSTLPKWKRDNWMNVQPSKHLVLICLACTMAKMLQCLPTGEVSTIISHHYPTQVMIFWKEILHAFSHFKFTFGNFWFFELKNQTRPLLLMIWDKKWKITIHFYCSLITIHRLLFTFHCSSVLFTTLLMPIYLEGGGGVPYVKLSFALEP